MSFPAQCALKYWGTAFLFALAVPLNVLAQPSFDCSRARTPDQQTICSNNQLSRVDLIANSGYMYLLRSLGEVQANTINLRFIRMRQACGYDRECILRSQLAAIREFKMYGAPIEIPFELSEPSPQPPIQQQPKYETPERSEACKKFPNLC